MSPRRVLVPWPDHADRIGPLPGGLEPVVWWEGQPRPDPDVLADVVFYVAHYMGAGDAVDILADLPALDVVHLQSAGFEAYAERLPDGVRLCNARGVHDASTSELAVGLILAVLRGIDVAARGMQQGRWLSFGERSTSLADRTVLILGYGSIGAALERRLAPFEVDIVRVARRPRPDDGVHGIDDLPGLLPSADVVVVLTPLTDQTRHLVDAAFLARLPDGALLVNVARGPVVDTDALVDELEANRLRAALDVTDPEPLPDGHPLWSAPNVLITPHRGGASTAFEPRIHALLRSQLARYAASKELVNVVKQA